MENKFYNIVFVVLVYKNTDVLRDFFENLDFPQSKVIVVNSYYDNKSSLECKSVAKQYDADFIECENRGYGYGNNIGVSYAISRYSFKFLVISNSDVIIKDFKGLENINIDKAIMSPETKMLTGKRQNPDTPWKLPLLFEVTSIALRYDMSWLYTLTHIYTRLAREIFLVMNRITNKRVTKIFSPHGSFFIVTSSAIKELHPLFDDRMFLYNEEWYLAMKARLLSIPVYYCPFLKILHLEGASSDTNKDAFLKYNKQSYTIFYKWLKSHN